MTDLPAAALEAAAEACPFVNRDALRRALEAAAPHLTPADPTTETEGFRAYKAGLAAGRAEGTAAERQRIRAVIEDEYGPTLARELCRKLLGAASVTVPISPAEAITAYALFQRCYQQRTKPWEDLAAWEQEGWREFFEAAARTIGVQAAAAERQRATDLLQTAWVVIANAGWDADDRDVAGRPDDWHEAAVRWRDRYHEWFADLLREDTP